MAYFDPVYISLCLLQKIMWPTFLELQLKYLFILNFFWAFKGIGFSFYNYITYLA